MENDDFWASLGVVASTILSSLAFIWNWGVLQVLFPYLAGAFSTYIVQSKLQDRTEKRRIRVRAIEEFHVPLYLEIENIKEGFLKNLDSSKVGSWRDLIKRHEMFTLEFKFRDKMQSFFERTQKAIETTRLIEGITSDIILKDFEDHLFPSLKESGLIKLETNITSLRIDRGNENIGFSIRIKNPYWMPEATIRNSAITKRNQIQTLKERFKLLETDQIVLFIKISYQSSQSFFPEQSYSIPIDEDTTFFIDFWNKIVADVHKNVDVQEFDHELEELKPLADDFLNRLKGLIEKYVTIQKL